MRRRLTLPPCGFAQNRGRLVRRALGDFSAGDTPLTDVVRVAFTVLAVAVRSQAPTASILTGNPKPQQSRAAGGLSEQRPSQHWSDRGVAAVHRQGRAGYVARLWRREENNSLGDLARVRGSAQRCRGAQLFQRVAERAGSALRAGGPGRDGVDTNPVGAEGRRPGPGE